jgi:phospholipid/cholesterol/gamma-HCH transport system substrate-binding protein
MDSRWSTRVAALVGIALLTATVGVALGVYQHAFSSTVPAQLSAPRAGLLLAPGADVRLRGLRVGQVESVNLVEGDRVEVRLELDPDKVRYIPASVEADITPTTIFGSKYVELQPGTGPQDGHLRPGVEIPVRQISSEANEMLAQLQDILTTVSPARLNATLTDMAIALRGRGSGLGDYIAQVGHYLAAINGKDDLGADLKLAAPVSRAYADASPDVLRILRNLTVTSGTVHENSVALHALLVDLQEAAGSGAALVGAISDPLTAALVLLRPVTAGLAEFAPEYPCLLHGLVRSRDLVYEVAGKHKPGIQGLVTLLPGVRGYGYPKDLPKIIGDPGPSCPDLELTVVHPRKFDDGTNRVFTDHDVITPGVDPAHIYLELVREWFGQSGVDALIADVSGAGR